MISETIPTGKVTFLFTDIEGSTLLWETQPDAMRSAFTRQEAIIRKTMADHGGYVYKMIGDAFQVAFSTASAALSAGLDAQRRLQAENWRVEGGLKVRMALHACVTEERGDDYVGPELNRVARILDVGYGGQALISQAVYELSHDCLPDGAVLHDLGEHYLKDLVYPEHIYQLVAPGLIKDFPHLKTDAPPPDLPHQTMPFVGRRAEMDQVEALLQDPICRLISLVGIGGSGKTSLAIHIAAQTRTFPGRIYFIELAAIHALDELIQAIAQAVGFSFQSPIRVSISIGEAQAQLLNYLAEKSALLVLDNFEQIMACADFVAELLAAAPRLKLLVTSRERLNLPGEWVVNVIGLPFPGKDASRPVSEYPAIQLFVNGMQRNGMTASSVEDFNAIARICRLLEGLPLGIEMAASLTKMLTPVEIAAEIERDLDFLTASWRGMPERHRTLRAVFDYSWRLLPEQEQEIFYRLAVFQGGFTREAAFEVVGAALASLTSLADKSFIHRVDSGRFDIRPVLKQYAEEKLSENAAAQAEMRTRHAHYYSDWLCCQFENLKGGEQVSALAALRAETVNLRTAWQQLLETGEIEPIVGFLPALLLFYVINDQRLETRAVTRLLSATEELLRRKVDTAGNLLHPDLLALVLAAIRQFSFDPRYREKLIPVMQESLQLVEALPDSQSKAFVYMLTCYVPTLEFHELLELCQNTIGIYTRLGDDWGLALAQVILADLLVFNGIELDLARRYYQSSLETFNRLGNIWGQALCYMGLNYVEGKAGNAQEAYRLGCHGVDLFTRLGNYERALKINHYLGDMAAGMGDLAAARRHYAAILAHVSRIGDDYLVEFYSDLLEEMSTEDKTTRSSSV